MNILQSIVEHKREEVASRKQKIKRSTLLESEFFNRTTVSLQTSLNNHKVFGIIAEIKRSSPSAGSLRPTVEPSKIAEEYEANGAAGISVLTDERFFAGTLDDLQRVRQSVTLPVLRKDFIVDEYQVYEAKAFGADAILLIAGVLERSQLCELHVAAQELGMECLVELYERAEIDILDFDRMKLIGINNRDLRTFKVDLNRTFTIAQTIPKDCTIVSESGIHTSDDLKRLQGAQIGAALIGEHFMKASDPGKSLRDLLSGLDDGRPR
ncbi:MAG: indole-3-glycerol phosphate synthase TrpC [Ignavibacteria bacterium]|nr:indole-3-glycerol phosphate synthase TrpC [Ignavibacteria bacterium]MBI3766280.1 indole-3-glycerol phosphate synthase TrpC [Ignavibacteriales bacterium]